METTYLTIPDKLVFHNRIWELQVRKTQMKDDASFMATYFHGVEPMVIQYGPTEQEAAEKAIAFVEKWYPSAKPFQPFDLEKFSEVVPLKKGEEKRAWVMAVFRKGFDKALAFTTDSFHSGLRFSVYWNAVYFESKEHENSHWI